MGAHVQMEYERIQALNWSSLKRIHTSPLLFRWRADHPEPDKSAYLFGRALHCAVLEPRRFPTAYAGYPVFGDGRTKAAQAAKADWLQSLPTGCEILQKKEYDSVIAAASSVLNHRVASELLSNGWSEKIVTWTDPDTGLSCKARLDHLRSSCVVELKSAREIGPRAFSRAVANYLYSGQLAYYHDGAIAAGLIAADDAEMPFVIAAETDEPFDVAVYRCTPELVASGRALYKRLLRKFVECTAADAWPGQAPDLLPLELPSWALETEEQEESVL